MKQCKRCERTLPLDQFGRDARHTDGLQSHCKDCKAAAQRAYAAAPAIRSRDRRQKRLRRLTNEEAHELVRRHRRRHYLRHRDELLARQRADRERFPDRFAARAAVASAIKHGVLKREPCSSCGRVEHVHAHHHRGYAPDHWLDIRWLCARCHAEQHWPWEETA